MSDKSIPEKLQVKPGRIFKVINQPPQMADLLSVLPASARFVESDETADVVLIFIKNMKELKQVLPVISTLLNPNGIAWLAYPKQTASIKTDLNRDIIWAYAKTLGWTGVAMISIDNTWSGFRLKRV